MWHTCPYCQQRELARLRKAKKADYPRDIMFQSRTQYVLCFLHWLEYQEKNSDQRPRPPVYSA